MKFLTVVVYEWIKHKCWCTFDPEMYAWVRDISMSYVVSIASAVA